MRLFAAPYQLVARADGHIRQGALLRFEFDEGVGYADLHPWPELGDLELASELKLLAEGHPGQLARRSTEFAKLDAIARAEGHWLFEGATVPPSHLSLPYKVTDLDLASAKNDGYKIIKVKGWQWTTSELEAIQNSGLKLRFDFNSRPSYEAAKKTLEGWKNIGSENLDWIDFIEDPCPCEVSTWNALRSEFGIRLGLDFEPSTPETPYDVVINKPARESPEEAINRHGKNGQSLVITSYLDHPVGQSFAAYSASVAVREGLNLETCGLVTHDVYTSTPFSDQLQVENSVLRPAPGTGIGFDDLLKKSEWTPL
jgi:O-succinylbenzoate synthase